MLETIEEGSSVSTILSRGQRKFFFLDLSIIREYYSKVMIDDIFFFVKKYSNVKSITRRTV